ncbi:MAG: TonB-dependent receptor [Paludibacteraceae bacterium]|jgi:TonB-linked SusC/RagA family outer membrane protein|nr:TonB-dependent receptor [Paludibacteraceae bacterium]MBR6112727.1 TonB-dependent receptor [Paludibacteraceae bacterium]
MRKVLLSVAMMSSALTVMADRTIKGVVKDAKEPLPFANVVIKGTTIGTNTDMDGNYEIEVPEGAILEFSYSGYETQTRKITAKTGSTLNVTLSEEMLEELVVTGYGVQKKTDVTGSVSSLNEAKLKESVATSIDQAMAGRVSGVSVTSSSGQPGQATSVRVRGVSTLNGSAEPLYVVDGMPIGGGDASHSASTNPLASINPADIVSMDVLKDASATAIYGSRAANGVVMITTRKGKSGDAKISYDGTFSMSQFTKRYDMMNLKEYAEYVTSDGYRNNINPETDALLINPSVLGEGTNWQDELFRNGLGHSHQVSASGGTDKTTYNISMGYTGQDGVMLSSDYKRINGRVNVETQAKEWMKIGMNVGVTRQEKTTIYNIKKTDATEASIGNNDQIDESVIVQSLLSLPSYSPYTVDGKPYGPPTNDGVKMNPIADLKMSPVERTEFNVLGTAFIDITLFDKKKADQKALDKKAQEESGDPAAKGEKTKMGENRLSWKNEFGIDVTNADETYFKPYYKINDAFKREADAANLSTGDYKNNSIRFSSYATWLRDFNKKHNLNLMLGTEFNKYSYEGLVMKYYGYEEGAIPLPTASTSSKTVGSNFKGEGSMASFFGRGVYSIAGKYILTATGRFDGSSNFAPGNKWGFFPSFSFAWRLEEEEWAKGKFKDVFSSFKVRAGYGQTGNANCAQAHLATVTNIGQSGTYSPGTYTNQNLKWETNSMINMGLDFGFQKSKLNVTIDGYYKKNKDLLLLQELPTYIAQSDYKYITPSYVNAGSIQNVGMDLQLSRRVERDVNERLKFAWESDLTFSLVRSKVLDLGSSCEAIYNNPQYALFSTKYNINRTVVDEAPGKFWGYKYIGIAQNQDEANAYNERTGRNIGVGDMMLSDEETWIGDPNPAFTAGWANSFSLGQWTLGVQFNATVGNDVYNLVRMKLENNAGDAKWWNQSADVLNYAVVKEVDGKKVVVNDSSIPAPTGTDKGQKSVSDRYVEDGSFLRLQNVALTYRFRPEANRKLHIDGLRISASCSNVCTITGYSGYDPENPGGATRQGVDEARYPSPRTYTLGLGFSF